MALPAVIQELIRLIGHGKAMELVHAFGGQELRIPRTENSDTWAALVEVIGEAATRVLAKVFGGGEPLYIALCAKSVRDDRNRKMISRYEQLLAEGHSGRGAVSILVRETGLCYRQVEKIVNSPVPEVSAMAVQWALF